MAAESSGGSISLPPELRAVAPLVESYTAARIHQFAGAFCRRLNVALPPSGLEVLVKEVLSGLQPAELTPSPSNQDLRLVLRHDCMASGCGDPSCMLCQYNTSRLCKRNLKSKYLIDDHLKAKCSASLRVELVDGNGRRMDEAASGVRRLEVNVLNGEKYKEACPENTLLTHGQLKPCIVTHHQKALLRRDGGGGGADDSLRVFLPLDHGVAQLSDLSVTTSSEALLCGKAPTFRLLIWGVDASGEPLPRVTYVVSEDFVVATKRVKHAIKSDIPSVGDHVSKLVHIGKATVEKLLDLRAAAREEGFELPVPAELATRLDKVGQFRHLVQLCEINTDTKHKVRHLLKLSPEKWEEVCSHALAAVVPDFRPRVWWHPTEPSVGLLWSCKNGSVVMDNPAGLILRGKTGAAAAGAAGGAAGGGDGGGSSSSEDQVVAVQQVGAAHFHKLAAWKAMALAGWYAAGHPGWGIYFKDPLTGAGGSLPPGDSGGLSGLGFGLLGGSGGSGGGGNGVAAAAGSGGGLAAGLLGAGNSLDLLMGGGGGGGISAGVSGDVAASLASLQRGASALQSMELPPLPSALLELNGARLVAVAAAASAAMAATAGGAVPMDSQPASTSGVLAPLRPLSVGGSAATAVAAASKPGGGAATALSPFAASAFQIGVAEAFGSMAAAAAAAGAGGASTSAAAANAAASPVVGGPSGTSAARCGSIEMLKTEDLPALDSRGASLFVTAPTLTTLPSDLVATGGGGGGGSVGGGFQWLNSLAGATSLGALLGGDTSSLGGGMGGGGMGSLTAQQAALFAAAANGANIAQLVATSSAGGAAALSAPTPSAAEQARQMSPKPGASLAAAAAAATSKS